MEIPGFSILHPVVGPQGSCQAGRSHPLADGEEQDHEERRPDISLLDGLMERRREGKAHSSRELQESRPRDHTPEGPKAQG